MFGPGEASWYWTLVANVKRAEARAMFRGKSVSRQSLLAEAVMVDLTDTPIMIRKSAVVALFIGDDPDEAYTTLYLAGGHTIVTLETYDDVADWLMPERIGDGTPPDNPYFQAS